MSTLGAVVLAFVTVGGFIVTALGIAGLWKKMGWWHWAGVAAVTIVLSIPVAAFFVSTLDDDESGPEAGTNEERARCVLAGQVFDQEGRPLSAARIVARKEGELGKTSLLGVSPLATTDAEGRFRGDCSGVKKPFLVAVNFEQGGDVDDHCEWWSWPYIEIKRNGDHQGLNIEIPVEDVRASAWPYADEYICSTSPWIE